MKFISRTYLLTENSISVIALAVCSVAEGANDLLYITDGAILLQTKGRRRENEVFS